MLSEFFHQRREDQPAVQTPEKIDSERESKLSEDLGESPEESRTVQKTGSSDWRTTPPRKEPKQKSRTTRGRRTQVEREKEVVLPDGVQNGSYCHHEASSGGKDRSRNSIPPGAFPQRRGDRETEKRIIYDFDGSSRRNFEDSREGKILEDPGRNNGNVTGGAVKGRNRVQKHGSTLEESLTHWTQHTKSDRLTGQTDHPLHKEDSGEHRHRFPRPHSEPLPTIGRGSTKDGPEDVFPFFPLFRPGPSEWGVKEREA